MTELYLWSLARHPTAKELKLGTSSSSKTARPTARRPPQDLMWALLNSKDFLLVH